MSQKYDNGSIRIQATLAGGLKTRFQTYAKDNEMKESEVIKEGIRQLLRKDNH